MAHIKTTMLATITADERCAGCKRLFEHGEVMSAVEFDDGDPAGWFCSSCIENWNDTHGAEE